MMKILKYGFIGWIVLSIITLPFYWPYLRMMWVFNPNVAAPKYETPTTETEARLQDIDYLSKLTDYDRAFSEAARTAFTVKLSAMRETAEDMDDAEFYLNVAEAVALADNGHTNISAYPQYTNFSTIGVRLYSFKDGVFILDADAEKVDTLGRRVVSVEGIPIEDVQAALTKYRGGNQTWRMLHSLFLIESPQLLAASGYAKSPDQIELALASKTGETETFQFAGLSADNPDDLPWRSAWETLTPSSGAPHAASWSHVMSEDGAAMPRYLTDTSNPLSYTLDGNGFYIRALPGFKAGDQSIKGAYKAILSEHAKASLDYLVVDFRIHDGGDYTKSMAFAKAAPKAVKDDGDIYLITGPNTFSAAIVTVAMLKYYAGDRGIIIGEQMGDRETFWAERGSRFGLPNSGYSINYATGYHDWEKGCKGEPYCFTMNEMHEVPAGLLAPEVTLPQDFESYRQGEDVVLEWIAEQR